MSKKVPINPMLSQGMKDFSENFSEEWGVSQSDFLSKLIDATKLYLEASGNDQISNQLVAISAGSLTLKMLEYHSGNQGFPGFEPTKKARRFYIRPSQRDWLKEKGGISDTVRAILSFYVVGVLDPYLPPEFKLGHTERSQDLREDFEKVSKSLEKAKMTIKG